MCYTLNIRNINEQLKVKQMRTTINIDDQLYVEIKKMAAQSKTTITSIIDDALKNMLLRKKTKHQIIKLNTFSSGTGLKHGVNINDNSSLLDIMEK